MRVRVFTHVLGGSFKSLRLIMKWTRIGNGKLTLSSPLPPSLSLARVWLTTLAGALKFNEPFPVLRSYTLPSIALINENGSTVPYEHLCWRHSVEFVVTERCLPRVSEAITMLQASTSSLISERDFASLLGIQTPFTNRVGARLQ